MFKIIRYDKNSSARTGTLETPHGVIKTPAFMPVGTLGTVKTTTPDELNDLGTDIILGNTYHLYLRPGDKEIKKLGGLHKFTRWNKPILTDSGGFQVFSLGKAKNGPIVSLSHCQNKFTGEDSNVAMKQCNNKNLVKITENGVRFKSHLDGSYHFFTPEKVIDIQMNLGSDIMMVLDECAPYPCSKEYARAAMERTHNWALKALNYYRNNLNIPKALNNPMLFGIIQGSTFKDLREKSAQFITSLPFDGIAIGGVSVGEGKKEMYKVLDWVMPLIRPISPIRPVYLMGVGTPEDLLEAVERGVDMFDCVLPTRLARHGAVWIHENSRGLIHQTENCGKTGLDKSRPYNGRINLLNSKFKSDKNPIMPGCQCYACKNGFSRAYIHHLLKEKEVLGMRLTTLHNLHFILDLMREIRDNIEKDSFSSFKKQFLKNWKR